MTNPPLYTMNFQFRYTLNEEELLEYMHYLFVLNPKNKRRCLWIKVSVPALLVFTLFYFQFFNQWLFLGSALLISVFWLFLISKKLWHRVLNRHVRNWFKGYQKNAAYSEVLVQFTDLKIIINDCNNYYEELLNIIPLRHVILFFHRPKQVFMIPQRVFDSEERLKEFSTLLAQKREEQLR